MEYIELVIKIPEDEYEDVKYFGTIVDEDRDYIASRILNGVILPKGHGNLVDMHFILRNAKSVQTIIDVNNAPTVIEADTSEGEDK